jgi:CrcB protein
MSGLTLVGIGVLGGVGAIARFLLDRAVSVRVDSPFPVGTLAVNCLGTAALGILVGATTDSQVLWLFGTGLLGGFTTFSTWAFETHRLAEDGELRLAALNYGVSLAGGIGLAWLGMQIGGAL